MTLRDQPVPDPQQLSVRQVSGGVDERAVGAQGRHAPDRPRAEPTLSSVNDETWPFDMETTAGREVDGRLGHRVIPSPTKVGPVTQGRVGRQDSKRGMDLQREGHRCLVRPVDARVDLHESWTLEHPARDTD